MRQHKVVEIEVKQGGWILFQAMAPEEHYKALMEIIHCCIQEYSAAEMGNINIEIQYYLAGSEK